MASAQIKMEYGKFYHIYNRGNNSCDLFRSDDHHLHFMRLYGEYIPQVAETFAWVLMKNHFHLLVRIKPEEEIPFMPLYELDAQGRRVRRDHRKAMPIGAVGDKKFNPTSQFKHLFNAYAQSFNYAQERTGSLFEKPFHRKEIDSLDYFRNVIVYIHRNPVQHQIVEDVADYPWSSYHTCLSMKPTHLAREKVLRCFGNETAEFMQLHRQGVDVMDVERYLQIG